MNKAIYSRGTLELLAKKLWKRLNKINRMGRFFYCIKNLASLCHWFLGGSIYTFYFPSDGSVSVIHGVFS